MFRLSKQFGKDPEKVVLLDLKKAERRLKDMGEKVFVNSMSDTFHEAIPFETIRAWFDLFEDFPEKQFQVLTKRINRALQFSKTYEIPKNVWLGTSIEDEAHLFRMQTLKHVDAKIRFISFEPLLGAIPYVNFVGISWVIVGGESDYKDPRPMDPDWAESIRKNCEDYATPFFFKQAGGIGGDNAGGSLLHGKGYKAFPIY